MQRFAIIAHCDSTERKTDTRGMKPVLAERLAKMFRWTRVAHDGCLWEEFAFLSSVLDLPQRLSVWDMPLFAGLHLASALQRMGCAVPPLVINCITPDNRDEVLGQLADFGPDGVILSTTFFLNIDQLASAVQQLRAALPSVPVIIGGNFIFKELSICGNLQQVVQKLPDNIYFVNDQHGEGCLQAILQGSAFSEAAADNGRLPGLLYKNAAGILLAADSGVTASDINAWPVDYLSAGREVVAAPLRTSAGCSFNCSFCSYPSSAGNRYLGKDIDVVLAELETARAAGAQHIVFLDDTLNFPVERFKRLLRQMVGRGLAGFCCYSFCRCQYLDEEAVQLMRRCGFQAVLLGIESGADSILENMNKRTTTAEYLPGIRLLREAGIITFGAIIVGFPGETAETVQETIRFLNESGLDYCYVQPFYYLHNSPVHRERERYGLEGEGLLWKHATMNAAECAEHLERMFFDITGPQYAHEEYAMWEYIYLRQKGYPAEFYRDYRSMINGLRARAIRGADVADYPSLPLAQFRERYAH